MTIYETDPKKPLLSRFYDDQHNCCVVTATVQQCSIDDDLHMGIFTLSPRPTQTTQVPTEDFSLSYEEVKFPTTDPHKDNGSTSSAGSALTLNLRVVPEVVRSRQPG
jgi:hypothetical protein